MEKRYDVFISYSSQDQKTVEGICGYLERKGYRCFVAYRDIPRGVVWATAIIEALDASKMMVVVFSNDFNVSPQTDREIELASENRMPILTYRVTDAQMTGAKKYYLKNLNWIDAFPNPEGYFGQLLNSVVKLIGPSTLEMENTTKQEVVQEIKANVQQPDLKPKSKKKALPWIIGGAAIVLIALVALFALPKGDAKDSDTRSMYHFIGQIAGANVHASMILDGSLVQGRYYYDSQRASGNKAFMEFFGNRDGDHLKLTESVNNKITGVFEGEWKDGVYEGSFTRTKDEKKFTFKLVETEDGTDLFDENEFGAK